jgi:hypothetical protein
VAVHIYTQTIHRTTHITTNVEECGPCTVFTSFTLVFALTEEKATINLSQFKKNLGRSTVYILPKTPTHYKTLTNTHTLQNSHIVNLGLPENRRFLVAV